MTDIYCLNCRMILGTVANYQAAPQLYAMEVDLLKQRLNNHCPNCNRVLNDKATTSRLDQARAWAKMKLEMRRAK